MKPKETFSETEPILDWSIKTDKKVKFIYLEIIDKDEAYAMTDTGHLVAIFKNRGYCTCEDFHFTKRKLKVPCKHLIRLKELMSDSDRSYMGKRQIRLP